MRLHFTDGNLKDALAKSRQYPATLHIGYIIRRLRELSGTSQCDLARHAAANLSYISSVESGMNNISIKKIQLLCNALRLTPSILVAIQNRIEYSAELLDADSGKPSS